MTVGVGFAGVDEGSCFVHRLRARLCESAGAVRVVDSALDGVCTGYAIRRFDRMVKRHQPDFVVVMLGLNDARPAGSRPPVAPQAYGANLVTLVQRVRAIDALPLLCTPTPRFDADDSGRDVMAPYVATVHHVGREHHVPTIECHRPLASGRRSRIPDGVHPGPEGHAIIAKTLVERLGAYLEEQRRSGRSSDASQVV